MLGTPAGSHRSIFTMPILGIPKVLILGHPWGT